LPEFPPQESQSPEFQFPDLAERERFDVRVPSANEPLGRTDCFLSALSAREGDLRATSVELTNDFFAPADVPGVEAIKSLRPVVDLPGEMPDFLVPVELIEGVLSTELPPVVGRLPTLKSFLPDPMLVVGAPGDLVTGVDGFEPIAFDREGVLVFLGLTVVTRGVVDPGFVSWLGRAETVGDFLPAVPAEPGDGRAVDFVPGLLRWTEGRLLDGELDLDVPDAEGRADGARVVVDGLERDAEGACEPPEPLARGADEPRADPRDDDADGLALPPPREDPAEEADGRPPPLLPPFPAHANCGSKTREHAKSVTPMRRQVFRVIRHLQ
jgi:hypothetical protein